MQLCSPHAEWILRIVSWDLHETSLLMSTKVIQVEFDGMGSMYADQSDACANCEQCRGHGGQKRTSAEELD